MAGVCLGSALLSGPVRLSGASMQKDLPNEGGDFVNSCIADVSGIAFLLGRVQPVMLRF